MAAEFAKKQCPYDPSHQLLPERFGVHLVKCRKSLEKNPTSPYYYKIDELTICKFNSQHHVAKKDLDEHHKSCPDSVAVLRALQKPMNEAQKLGNISDIMSGVHLVQSLCNDDEDDWDSAAPVPAYDPSVKAANLPMHLPQGLTPSERRNYRMAKRIGQEDPEGNAHLPVGMANPGKPSKKK